MVSALTAKMRLERARRVESNSLVNTPKRARGRKKAYKHWSLKSDGQTDEPEKIAKF
jgi:hypothetical protein